MKGELSLKKRCIWNWDHGKKIEYLEEKGKKQSLKLYLVSHGDRYGGSQCVPTGSICVHKNIMILKSLKVQEKSFQAFVCVYLNAIELKKERSFANLSHQEQ